MSNFHLIKNAANEAFVTGRMGETFDYTLLNKTLEEVDKHKNQNMMSEVEENIYSKSWNNEGKETVDYDYGYPDTKIDWEKMPQWKDRVIPNVPKFELHHGFDIPKDEHPKQPIELPDLIKKTSEAGFSVGGWFIFGKKGLWAYRCNEFSNDNYDNCMKNLSQQAKALRTISLILV